MSNSYYPDAGPAPASGDLPPDQSGAEDMSQTGLPVGIIPRLLALRDEIIELLLLLGIDDSIGGAAPEQDPSQDPSMQEAPPDQLGPYSDVPDNAASQRIKSMIARLNSGEPEDRFLA